jgi:hypothetical protein
MRIGEGKPSAADAPHFGELRIDVSLSEPDYKIGVDNEQIASMACDSSIMLRPLFGNLRSCR